MQITFISTFVPRKCGIATYTRDLAGELIRQGNSISVIAMENPIIPASYKEPVVDTISQEKVADYRRIAGLLNASHADVVHLQHEFGLFGGSDGEYILELATRLSKIFLVTFHTVLLSPSEHQKYIIQSLARLSRRITVMDEIAKDRLVHVYDLNPKDITVIYHGSPVVKMSSMEAKKKIDYPDSFILLANNLLSRNKGIEYAIGAVAEVRREIKNLIFLVVGETHPLVRVAEGESYRRELIALVKKLHLEKQVIFKNIYVSIEELKLLLAAADIYITPYLDPQQITSGTLSYALGADKACIASEYIYAKEMLANGKGVLVPFRDTRAIARALLDLYRHPGKRRRMEKQVYTIGKNMNWKKVAQKHNNLYRQVVREEHIISCSARQYISKPLDISYLTYLTDTVGIMQHAYHIIPDRRFGYSTDDNARALIIASELLKKRKSKQISDMVKIYVSFLQFAQDSDGKIHTFLDFHRNWTDEAAVNDAYGKTMWALGHYLYTNKLSYFSEPIQILFATGMKQIYYIRHLRTAAYTILGLYYYISVFDSRTDTALLALSDIRWLADFLLKSYNEKSDDTWHWFETEITYDNFRLPQALHAAYLVTRDLRYKKVADAALEFITGCNFDANRGYFDFIGQNGWYKKGGKKVEYDQQPLEAAGAVDAYLFAGKINAKRQYLERAFLSFGWFFGSNRNHRPMYNPVTKGVRDGLTLRGVNQNEGAESLVCFLMAALSLQKAHKSDSTEVTGTVATPITRSAAP